MFDGGNGLISLKNKHVYHFARKVIKMESNRNSNLNILILKKFQTFYFFTHFYVHYITFAVHPIQIFLVCRNKNV